VSNEAVVCTIGFSEWQFVRGQSGCRGEVFQSRKGLSSVWIPVDALLEAIG
jgi:hypothetical protein